LPSYGFSKITILQLKISYLNYLVDILSLSKGPSAMKNQIRRSTISLAAAGVLMTMSATAALADGIPTAVGVDHIGLTVPNLKQGIDFFTKVLGCTHVYTAGPFSDPKGDWMKTNLNVDPRATALIGMVRCGPTQNVELFQYTAKDQVETPPKNSDVGGMHIAFYVKDLPKAVAYLKSTPGVRVLGTPTPVSAQPNGDETFVYFLTPWGQTMEILTYPNGLAYEKTTKARLYSVNH
jgi:catechol 2,3-dioxygenase-like lactoylglutathione lyase family enzyme